MSSKYAIIMFFNYLLYYWSTHEVKDEIVDQFITISSKYAIIHVSN